MPANVIATKLVADVTAFNKAMASASASLSNVGRTMMSVGKSAAALSIALTGVGVVVTKVFADFEKRMVSVGVISGATADQFEMLTASAKNLGATTLFTAREAADGMEILAKAGFSVNEIMSATPGVLNLATAASLELGEASDTVIGILRGYGKTAEEVGQVNDVLVKTFTSTNVTVGDLGQTFGLVAPIAKTAGLQFEEVSAAIGLLGNAGIKGTRAGTALRKAIIAFSAPTPKARRQLKRLGVEVLDAAGNMKPLNEIVDQLGAATGPKLIKVLSDIVGVRPAAALATLVDQGGASLRGLTRELENAGGTAQRIADKQIATLSGQFTILKSKIEAVTLDMGQRLAPVAEELVQIFQDAVDFVAGLSDEFKNTAVRIGVMTAGISALIAVVVTLGTVLGGLALLAGTVVAAIVLAFGPLIAILLGVILVVGRVKRAWSSNWMDIRDTVVNVAQTIKQAHVDAFNFIKWQVEIVGKFILGVIEKVDRALRQFRESVRKATGGEFRSALGAGVAGAGAQFGARPPKSDTRQAAKEIAGEILADLGEDLKAGLSVLFEGLKAVVPPGAIKALEAAKKRFDAMVSSIGKGSKQIIDDTRIFGLQGKVVSDSLSANISFMSDFRTALMGVGEALKEAGRVAANVFLPMLKKAVTGLAGQVLQGAIQGAEVGGPAGAVAGAISALVLASETFSKLLALANQHLQFMADTIGMVLDPLRPLIGTLFMFTRALIVANPLLILLGIALEALEPLFRLIFVTLKFFGIAVLSVAKFLLKTAGFRNKAKKVGEMLDELKNTTFDTVGDIDELGDAASAAAEALFNVPQGFKVAAERFRAQQPNEGGGTGGGGFDPSPGPGPGGDFPDLEDTPGSGDPIGTAEGAATAGGITITVVHPSPSEFVDEVTRIMERRHIARRGVPVTGGQFITRRGK